MGIQHIDCKYALIKGMSLCLRTASNIKGSINEASQAGVTLMTQQKEHSIAARVTIGLHYKTVVSGIYGN